jgi:hypothetical protein
MATRWAVVPCASTKLRTSPALVAAAVVRAAVAVAADMAVAVVVAVVAVAAGKPVPQD